MLFRSQTRDGIISKEEWDKIHPDEKSEGPLNKESINKEEQLDLPPKKLDDKQTPIKGDDLEEIGVSPMTYER